MKTTHAVIVIPTYNERGNIGGLIEAILQQNRIPKKIKISILVVDDFSPDGTAELVGEYAQKHNNVHLIQGKKAGLGVAYVRGFKHALGVLNADIIAQMDADFSHSPEDISRLLKGVETQKHFVIGSRYVPGGSIPGEWSVFRILNSRIGNWVAQRVAGLKHVNDCTSGFRSIHASLMRKINLDTIGAQGYSFQMNLLYQAVAHGAKIVEIPIKFLDRKQGTSKMGLNDIVEFIFNAFRLRFQNLKEKKQRIIRSTYSIVSVVEIVASIALIVYAVLTDLISIGTVALGLFTIVSLLIALQSIFTLWCMIYAWEEPERVEKNKSPSKFNSPKYSFTALLPALHEEAVIGETIRAIAKINYPAELRETLIICRYDDIGTIQAAKKAIEELGVDNIRLVIPEFLPKNKPEKLNYALKFASNDVVCVFDAEDSPHKDLYAVINTVFVRDKVDIVQSGVQLINFRSHWFSTLNVLEYYFWFKSVLHVFADKQVIPLGGNTVFFKKRWLQKVHGWDANCLTEDADIGIRLSTLGAKMRIIYDEIHATQEETPINSMSFIRQRTRWNQGFIQIFKKYGWTELPTLSQKLLTAYILIWPEIQAGMFVYILCSIIMMFTVKVPILLALISALPFYILAMHFVILNVGLYEFTRNYGYQYRWWMPLKILITFMPFQLVLGWSALRAVYRENRHNGDWEKTQHVNGHRLKLAPSRIIYNA